MCGRVNNHPGPGESPAQRIKRIKKREGKESGCTLLLMGYGCVCDHAPACGMIVHSPFRKMGRFYRFQKVGLEVQVSERVR